MTWSESDMAASSRVSVILATAILACRLVVRIAFRRRWRPSGWRIICKARRRHRFPLDGYWRWLVLLGSSSLRLQRLFDYFIFRCFDVQVVQARLDRIQTDRGFRRWFERCQHDIATARHADDVEHQGLAGLMGWVAGILRWIR